MGNKPKLRMMHGYMLGPYVVWHGERVPSGFSTWSGGQLPPKPAGAPGSSRKRLTRAASGRPGSNGCVMRMKAKYQL
jgi:hypothetical protein